jgi:8-amino-3,8-dideoxy-alpha-D-manno-octulosonate transaminase
MPGFEIIDEKEKKAIEKIFLDGGVLFAHGFESIRKEFNVREFEKQSSKKFKCNHALAVSSGTAAIKIGLKALAVKPGDEVITQAFNFIATVEAILDIGAKPIIANVDNSLNMDPKDVETLITSKTKVILPVHMLGVPVDMRQIIKISKKNNLRILEDNCESVGAKYDGKYLGTIGDIGALSFDFGKVITTGEGGMILTQDQKLNKYVREYHDHGHENKSSLPRGRDTRTIYGFNYRMTEMQGAIGKVQLSKLDKIILNNKKRYRALLNFMENKFKIRKTPNNSESIYDTLILFEEDRNLREKIVQLLIREGFGTKNLPDAIEWHCSSFWDHALTKDQISRSKLTRDLLQKSIAIPIWLKKTVKEYSTLGKKIKKI